MRATLVSLDWDFMFPSVDGYDWGHREAMLFIEQLWVFRYGEHDLFTKEVAHEKLRVDKTRYSMIVKKVLTGLNPQAICVSESHAAIVEFVESVWPKRLGGIELWNFDAHHDSGYGQDKLECGNWVLSLVKKDTLREYTLVYPDWRKAEPEGGFNPNKFQRCHVRTMYASDFKKVANNDIRLLFVCRSGAWTPPWEDGRWLSLLEAIGDQYPAEYRTKAYQEMALHPREFDEAKAIEVMKQFETMRRVSG